MIRGVLFDRDGTLIADARGNYSQIAPMPNASRSLQRLRDRDIRIGVVTNQPAIARGEIGYAELRDVHDRIERVLGPVDGWFVCPHGENSGCACRKPQVGLIHAACRQFGITPRECVVIGDIGSDVDAALNAGAQAILIPTPVTLAEEIARAPVVCRDLDEAVDRVLEVLPVS